MSGLSTTTADSDAAKHFAPHFANHFAQSYAEARSKFLAAARAAGLAVESHAHPLAGRDGEPLAMDVARFGAADATSLLIVSSACHGVEGFCGSGVQHALLTDPAWHAQAAAAGVAVLYIHALNPHGFSWWRRVTQENVDLNRNFHDFTAALPRNAGYDELAPYLVPDEWPPTPGNEAHVAAFIAKNGDKGFQAAVSGGQHDHPQGLFFGGRAPTWSNASFRAVLRQHARQCQRIGWIDLHTGLGPNGHGELIYAGRDDATTVALARAWWGPQVTSIYDGTSTSAPLTGLMCAAVYEECPQAVYTGIALEYGTLPTQEVIHALRADHWLHAHPEASDEQRRAIKQQVRDAFYIDTDVWKRQIVEQGFVAARAAAVGLESLG